MDHLVYTAMSGAARTLEQQSVISNNLANVNTTGFRQQLSLYRAVPIVGQAGEHQTRASTLTTTPGSLMEQGAMAETGDPLDLAIAGKGWFAVQTPQGEAYTRAGDFMISPEHAGHGHRPAGAVGRRSTHGSARTRQPDLLT